GELPNRVSQQTQAKRSALLRSPLRPPPRLPVEPPDRKCGGERGAPLQRENHESLSHVGANPFDGEECYNRRLPSHEQLPCVGSGAFVGLPRHTEPCSSKKNHAKSGGRHCDGNQSARPLQQCAIHKPSPFLPICKLLCITKNSG